MKKNENLTPEQAAKIEAFQEHFWDFDWDENTGEDWVELMHECLDAAGLDFNSRENIEGFTNYLEPIWTELGDQERELCEQMRTVFREAGATEAQLTWGMLDHVPITRSQERQLNRLSKKLDDVRAKMLPVMGLAAALNEARAELG